MKSVARNTRPRAKNKPEEKVGFRRHNPNGQGDKNKKERECKFKRSILIPDSAGCYVD